MSLWLAENEPRDYTYVCTPTGDELPEMFEHWVKLGKLLGKPILPVTHRLDLNGLIAEQNALPNYRMRWCTRMLKIEPYRLWLAANTPCVSYVGLRADEEGRAGGIYDDIPDVTTRLPLREIGWGEGDVWDYLDKKGVKIPARTDCARCFFQRLYEWHALWLNHPEVYAHAERQEKEIGHTFRSDGRDTWPASLEGLRLEFEKGRVPKPRGEALKRLQCRSCTL